MVNVPVHMLPKELPVLIYRQIFPDIIWLHFASLAYALTRRKILLDKN